MDKISDEAAAEIKKLQERQQAIQQQIQGIMRLAVRQAGHDPDRSQVNLQTREIQPQPSQTPQPPPMPDEPLGDNE